MGFAEEAEMPFPGTSIVSLLPTRNPRQKGIHEHKLLYLASELGRIQVGNIIGAENPSPFMSARRSCAIVFLS